MKKILVLFFLITLVQMTKAQGFYPLQIGNLWQYRETDPRAPGILDAQVTGQTIQNSQTYLTVSGFGAGPDAGYLRQIGDSVYAYSLTDTSEYLLCNFAAKVGDTISIRLNSRRIIILSSKDSVNFYGRILQRWIFSEVGPAWFATRQIIDSIGMVNIFMEPGVTYYLQGSIINGIQYGAVTSVNSGLGELPTQFILGQNYPNPFNPSTAIQYSVGQSGMVILKVLDILGRDIDVLVAKRHEPGSYSTSWNAGTNPSGVYFCKLISNNFISARKMLFLK